MAFSVPIPIDQLANYGSTVTIEETESPLPGKKPRKLVLAGGGLPKKNAIDWTSEMRMVTTWFPGNGTEATQQVLGPMDPPSSWAGEWNRTRLGRTPCAFTDENGATKAIVDPMVLWAIVDTVQRQGARLRVTWTVRGREIVGLGDTDRAVDVNVTREGRLKSFKVSPAMHTDIPWTMEWHWASRGGKQNRAAQIAQDEDLSAATSALSSSILATLLYQQVLMGVPDGLKDIPNHITLGQLESLARTPLLKVNNMLAKLRLTQGNFERAGLLAKKLQATPYAIANSVLGFARDSVTSATSFVDEMGRVPFEKTATKTKVSDLARSWRLFSMVVEQTTGVARQATELDAKMRRTLVAGANRGALSVRDSSSTRAGDIIGVYMAKAGDTPERVSTKYYKTADQGEAILRANRLPLYTPTFRTGQILVIPALAGGPSSA